MPARASGCARRRESIAADEHRGAESRRGHDLPHAGAQLSSQREARLVEPCIGVFADREVQIRGAALTAPRFELHVGELERLAERAAEPGLGDRDAPGAAATVSTTRIPHEPVVARQRPRADAEERVEPAALPQTQGLVVDARAVIGDDIAPRLDVGRDRADLDIGERERVAEDEQSRRRRRQPRRQLAGVDEVGLQTEVAQEREPALPRAQRGPCVAPRS